MTVVCVFIRDKTAPSEYLSIEFLYLGFKKIINQHFLGIIINSAPESQFSKAVGSVNTEQQQYTKKIVPLSFTALSLLSDFSFSEHILRLTIYVRQGNS
jgi:hypothetical protein